VGVYGFRDRRVGERAWCWQMRPQATPPRSRKMQARLGGRLKIGK
jgi:hypothetical protein